MALSQFSSDRFKRFLKQNGVASLNSHPYYPQANGIAERMVQTVKSSFKKIFVDKQLYNNRDVQKIIDNFLFTSRNTPSSTGISPADYLLKRTPRRILKQIQLPLGQSTTSFVPRAMQFHNEQQVMIRYQNIWETATVLKAISPTCFLVNYKGTVKMAHHHQMRPIHTNITLPNSDEPVTNSPNPIDESLQQNPTPETNSAEKIQDSNRNPVEHSEEIVIVGSNAEQQRFTN